MSKVTIELTSEQQEQIRHETGDEVIGFTWEPLENRDAPKVVGADISELVRTGGNAKWVLRDLGSTVDPPAS